MPAPCERMKIITGRAIRARAKRWCPQPHRGQSESVPQVYFDEPIAGRYDTDFVDMLQPAVVDPAVSFLARLAEQGRALEFGIGTGRQHRTTPRATRAAR
jgi:hypothetical protein